jgi:hypothetical protein
VQALDDSAERQRSLEANDAVDKIIALETDGAISIPG